MNRVVEQTRTAAEVRELADWLRSRHTMEGPQKTSLPNGRIEIALRAYATLLDVVEKGVPDHVVDIGLTELRVEGGPITRMRAALNAALRELTGVKP